MFDLIDESNANEIDSDAALLPQSECRNGSLQDVLN